MSRLQAIAAIEQKIKDAEAELERAGPERDRGCSRPGCEGLDRESHSPPIMSGQIGDFPLDAIKNLKVENRADPTKPGQAFEGPRWSRGGSARP